MYRPEPTSRHPLIVALLVILLCIGMSILFGAPPPGSIEDQLHNGIAVKLWGFSLGGGGAIYLIALALQGTERVRPFTMGVAFEQVGAAMLGVAAILYAVAIMATVGWSGALPAGITFVLGVFALYRWINILRGIVKMSRAAAAA